MDPIPDSTLPRPATQRRMLRDERRALSPREQDRHAAAVTRRLARERWWVAARRIGGYRANDGELDPRALLRTPLGRAKHCYLPVLRRRRGGLWFVRFRPGDRMRRNRFGIPEPARRGRHLRLAWTLDLLLVPLVGFDEDCNRIGMGGGFYDRTLAHLRRRGHWRHPRLIGIAHECQRVPRIEPRPWDVPLDAVVTERRVYRRARHHNPGP